MRKIIRTVVTRCQILGLKCTKIVFSRCSAPDPAGEAYSFLQHSHISPCWNKGDLLLTEGEGCRKGKGRRERVRQGEQREGRREEGSGGDLHVYLQISKFVLFFIYIYIINFLSETSVLRVFTVAQQKLAKLEIFFLTIQSVPNSCVILRSHIVFHDD